MSRYNYVGYAKVVTEYIDEQLSLRLPLLGYPKYSDLRDLALDSKFYLSNNPRTGLLLLGSITPRLKRREFDFDYYTLRLGIGLVLKKSIL